MFFIRIVRCDLWAPARQWTNTFRPASISVSMYFNTGLRKETRSFCNVFISSSVTDIVESSCLRLPDVFPPPGDVEIVVAQQSGVVVLDVVSAVDDSLDVLLLQYLQVPGRPFSS